MIKGSVPTPHVMPVAVPIWVECVVMACEAERIGAKALLGEEIS